MIQYGIFGLARLDDALAFSGPGIEIKHSRPSDARRVNTNNRYRSSGLNGSIHRSSLVNLQCLIIYTMQRLIQISPRQRRILCPLRHSVREYSIPILPYIVSGSGIRYLGLYPSCTSFPS
jgi:hypothetical protein